MAREQTPAGAGPGESKKKAGAEGRSCSGLKRGRKENDVNRLIAGIRPRSPCSIAILPVRCKESPLRPGREG